MTRDSTTLSLLGGFLLNVNGERRDIPTRKTKALLCRLALEPGPLPRAALAGLLWPDSAPAAARHSLRQALTELRRALDGATLRLTVTAGEVALEPGDARVDVREFRARAASADPADWERAMAQYRGALLEGLDAGVDTFDAWLEDVRHALEQTAIRLCHDLAEHHADHVERAIEWNKRLLALDPLDETAHRDLMQLYIQADRDGAAIKQFLHCRSVLARELGIEPGAETRALYAALLQHRTGRRAPATTVGAPASAPNREAGELGRRLRPAVVLACELSIDESDPERAEARWQQDLDEVSQLVRSYGGQVVAHVGRQILCAFGLERVRGTEADRACLAGEELTATVPGLRCGIASGQVLLRPDAGSFVGQAAADAQSLCGRAGPGEVLVSEPVMGARRWRAGDGAPGEPPVRAAETASGREPLIGRAMEIRQFVAVLDACRDGSQGCAMLLRGEPGIGKTRLAREYADLARKEDFVVHVAQAYDFGMARGNDPLAQLVRSLAGQRTPNAAGLAARVDATHVPYLLALLDADSADPVRELASLSPFDRMERTAAALGALTLAAARDCAQLIVVDDLHWADRLTLAVLPRLARAVVDLPVVVLMTSRVAGEALDPEWRAAMGDTPLVTLDLHPLRAPEASRLASELGAEPARLGELLARAAGNPLFLKQLVRFGHAGEELPHSIQSLAVAQLDALPEAAQAGVRAASILGQQFTLEALKATAGAPPQLEAAVESGLIVPGPAEWRFHHALIRDGIYQNVLPSERRALHRQAAEYFRERSRSLCARHLDLADADEALPALLDAATDEIDHYRLSLARSLLERALAREPNDPRAILIDAQLDLMVGNTTKAVAGFRACRKAASSIGLEAQALVGLGMALNQLDDSKGAVDALDEATRLNVEDPAHQADAWLQLGNALFPLGLAERCFEAHRNSLAHAERAGSTLRQARAEGGLGDACYQQGAMVTAFRHYDRCVALGEAHGHPGVVPPNLAMRGLTRLFLLELDAALADAARALALARQSSNLRHELLAHNVAASIETFHGNIDHGLEHSRRTMELASRIGSRRFLIDSYAQQVHLLWLAGRLAEARELLDRALEVLDDTLMPFAGAYVRGLQAACATTVRQRRAHLRDGERLLGSHAVSHCHLYFYAAAMETTLTLHELADALRYADALAAYTAREPLPFADFYVRRAYLLAGRSDHPEAERAELIAQGEACGLRVALPLLTQGTSGSE
jgi:DNA-binding SARP family transcriptional activator/tetratricopeptide (TPR) repeat protein